jgi:hypothetical protein
MVRRLDWRRRHRRALHAREVPHRRLDGPGGRELGIWGGRLAHRCPRLRLLFRPDLSTGCRVHLGVRAPSRKRVLRRDGTITVCNAVACVVH